jgi:Tfp pilus assembly protein PilV
MNHTRPYYALQQHRLSPASTDSAGLTLIELLLSMVIIAMIGLAITAMLTSVSNGTDAQEDVRGVSIRQKVVTARLDAALRSAKQVLAVGDDYIVLWTADSRVDDQPNLSELRRIEFTPADRQLTSHQAEFPGDMTSDQRQAADTTYDLTDDFDQVTRDLADSPYWSATVWAKQVTDWQIALDSAAPSLARLIRYELTVSEGQSQLLAIGSVAPRNR